MSNEESERAKALTDLEQATSPHTAAYIMSKLPPNNWNELATKSDLADLATKADLANFATKADLANYPTKAELAEALSNVATKTELAQLELRVERALHRQTNTILAALIGWGTFIIAACSVMVAFAG